MHKTVKNTFFISLFFKIAAIYFEIFEKTNELYTISLAIRGLIPVNKSIICLFNGISFNKNFSFIMNQNGEWGVAPAYDMTFIFNRGGFLPQVERCLMIRGKLQNITKSDILDFARDNAIRRPYRIINKVVSAVKAFRKIAMEYNVKDEWINRVELCLSNNLNEWGLDAVNIDIIRFKVGKKMVENPRVEQVYKGNFHLYVTIDGKERKRVIRLGTEEHGLICKVGIQNLTKEDFVMLVEKFWID